MTAENLSTLAPRRRRLEELRSLLRESGWRAAAWRVARSLIARILWLETDWVVARSLTGREQWRGRERLDVRPLEGPDDPAFRTLLRHADSERLSRWCAGYLKNGYHAFVASRAGVPIGLMWWVDERIPAARTHPHLRRFSIHLGSRDAYLFDYFIPAGHRGGGNANEFLTKIEAAMGRLGYQRLFGSVDVDNKQARWLYSLHGWEDVRRFRCWTLFKVLLFTNRAVFVRNGPRRSPHGFDFRQVVPRVSSS